MRKQTAAQAEVVTYLRARGGLVQDADGKASTAIATALACSKQVMVQRLARLEERGEVVRGVRGRRTYWVALPGHEPTPASLAGPTAPLPVRRTVVEVPACETCGEPRSAHRRRYLGQGRWELVCPRQQEPAAPSPPQAAEPEPPAHLAAVPAPPPDADARPDVRALADALLARAAEALAERAEFEALQDKYADAVDELARLKHRVRELEQRGWEALVEELRG